MTASVIRRHLRPAVGRSMPMRQDRAGRATKGRAFMQLRRREFLHLASGAAAVLALSRGARAQAYPARPLKLVIPFPPGGAFDAVGRPWADKMKPLLGTI